MSRLMTVLAVTYVGALALAATSITPQTFVEQAATAGMAEVELGRIAKERATNPQVKQFAEMMIKDHSAADSALTAIAQKHGVTVPKGMTVEQQAAATALRDKSGAAFDAAYAAQMVQDHQKAVDLFQQASGDQSLDAELRTFAEKTLPTLQHHLQEAQKLNDAVAQR